MKSTAAISSKPDLTIHGRILFLDNLRAIAIIMVVGVHTLGYCIPLPEHQKTIISFIVHAVSVPTFFLVDGYLFARKITFLKKYDYIQTIQKSMLRLLLPWAIFTIFYVIARYWFELSGFLKESLIIGHSFHEVALSAYGSVIAPQMYFLASLFLIRLCGPIFKLTVIIKNYYFLLFLFISYFLGYKSCINIISPYLRIEGGQEPILHALWGIQFYFLGIIFFRTTEIFNPKKLFIPFFILLLIVLLFKNEFRQSWQILAQYSYLITLTLFFMCIDKKLTLFDIIGKNTMGIFLLHAPIVLKGVSLIFNKFISSPILSFVSILIGTFLLTFLIVIVVNYIPYGPILFGEFYKSHIPSTANKTNSDDAKKCTADLQR